MTLNVYHGCLQTTIKIHIFRDTATEYVTTQVAYTAGSAANGIRNLQS